MSFSSDSVTCEKLGSLGLIAATIQRLGIPEKIDSRIELNHSKGGIVSHGCRVAAMILNGLGFMNSRLYMTPHFFEDKPVQALLGTEINSSHLNDDCLGRGLDAIADYGVTKLYSEIAFEVSKEQNILAKRAHLDTTSFVLYGCYENHDEASPLPAHGYSKANRPDLKQVMLSLTQGGAANIPLWMEALNGNSSDQTSFQATVKRIQAFRDGLSEMNDALCFVVDAAFYTPKKLAELNGVLWLTRVPAQLKDACRLLRALNHELTWQDIDDNYRFVEVCTTQYGLQQRWLLVESKHAAARELKTFQRRLDKQADVLQKKLWHLGNQVFACEHDANKALKPILKSLKHHQIEYQLVPVKQYKKKGRPSKNEDKIIVGYKIEATLSSCLQSIKATKETLGRFILATNQLDETSLSAKDMLTQYKEQSSVESGFKFMKDSAFELDSFYLKTPKRIGALMMVMTLCLMVYNFAQYHMRKCIEENDDVLPNQNGRPTNKPTFKWVAELMEMITVATIRHENTVHRVVANVKKVHQRIIAYFGPPALEIYGLPPDLIKVKIEHEKFTNISHWYRE